MTRILIIDGHPDPDRARFVHALADNYAEGAAGTHEVKRVDVATLDFPILRSQQDWQEGTPAPDVASAQEAIRWAEHIVMLYPMWLGDLPGLFKAFLEQVARPNFAFQYVEGRLPRKLLCGRSVRIIVTMGMPATFYRLFYRAHSLKSLTRNILRFVGLGPVRHSLVGSVESGDGYRQTWLRAMRQLGAQGR